MIAVAAGGGVAVQRQLKSSGAAVPPLLLLTTLTTVIVACWSLLVRVQVLFSPRATVTLPSSSQSPEKPLNV